MATSTQNQTTYHALNHPVRVRVADIKNDLTSNDTGSKYIEAVVQLVWPYSSTTSQLSLLLIEKDVSLRDVTAQIRVTFHDACAKQVAQSKIGIGDTLRLDLRGVSTEDEHEELSTPGKKAGYDLHFRKNVILKAFTYDGQVKVLDFVAPVPPVVLNGTRSTPETPFRNGNIEISKTRLLSNTPGSKRLPRISLNSFPGSLTDPFTEDDGSIEGYGRKRTKFARRSNQWRLADVSDEESESRIEEAQSTPILEQAAVDSDIRITPVFDLRGTSTNDVHMSTGKGQEIPQPDQIEEHDDIEQEIRNPKIISIDEEDPTMSVQKVELVKPTDHLLASGELMPTPSEPQIPVERITPDRASTVPIQTPMLTTLASPGLPLVSPFMFRIHDFPAISQVMTNLDTAAPTVNEPLIQHPPVNQQESYSFSYATEQILPPQSATTKAVATSVEDIQPHHVLPAPFTEEAEVDLDKLQEQIDMNNAEFVPEALDHVIEDEDMYGPPQDRDVGVILQHIEDIQSRISTEEPEDILQDPKLTDSINEPRINDGVWDGFDGAYATPRVPISRLVSRDNPFQDLMPDQLAFQPYPFQFENQTEVAEHVGDEFGNRPEEQAPVPSTPKSTGQPLQYLDGVSPMVNEDSPHMVELPPTTKIDAVQTNHASPQYEMGQSPTLVVPISTSVEDTMDTGSQKSINYIILDPSSTSQQPEADELESDSPHAQLAGRETYVGSGSNMPKHALTPEATQVTGTHVSDGIVLDNLTHVQLPPTPIESQVATSQQYTVENQSLGHSSQPLLDAIDVTPIRPLPGRIIRDRDDDEGIASPYFTSNTSMLMPTSAMSSIKVPATSRMRLRSSSPADLPADYLEAERLAAIELPINQNSIIPSQELSQPEAKGGTATPLEYYVHLNTLDEYYNRHVDIMAVCSADSGTPARAKSGAKDFFTTIYLVDRSLQETNNTITAQIFRPRKTAIPTVRRGDVLLLRRFKVQTKSHVPMLLSTDESAWAVYQSHDPTDANGTNDIKLVDTPIVDGPPVEYGPFETDNASRLLHWWLTDGSKHQFEVVAGSSPVKAAEKSTGARPRNPIPAPIDLRRSSRKTRKTASIDMDHNLTSPTFQPESPAISHVTVPSSQSRASPHSPASVRSTRSQLSPLKQVKPTINAPVSSPLTKTRSKVQKQSAPPSPNLEHPATLTPGFPSTAPRNFSSSNSVASSVTQTSVSSKRRRYERRSTSLVHKLRDGTEWVDIEQEEIFSVTESESESDGDGDDDASEQGEPADHDQGLSQNPTGTTNEAQSAAHQPKPHQTAAQPETEVDTPSKKPRGRPRKNTNPKSRAPLAATVNDTGDLLDFPINQPVPQVELEGDTIMVTDTPASPSSPSSPVVEAAIQSPTQDRVTRSQAANAKGGG